MPVSCPRCSATLPSVKSGEIVVCRQCGFGPAQDRSASKTDADAAAVDAAVESLTAAESVADLGRFGHYEVLGFLAKGGMGAVFRARDTRTGQVVALKVPSGKKLADPVEMQRFTREARLAQRLRHPNICPLLEVGECDGRPYIALEYVKGRPLLPWVIHRRPTLEDVSRLVAELARAVGYAHREGIIHRDIKPGNIMVTDDDGRPILLDFGLAREPEDQTMLTEDGICVGTPAYMSPEQAFDRHRPTPLADVYGLGAVLYELLSGWPPYAGPPMQVLTKLLDGPPPRPREANPDLPEPLETVCLTAMSREIEFRFQTADDLADAIEKVLDGDPDAAAADGDPTPPAAAQLFPDSLTDSEPEPAPAAETGAAPAQPAAAAPPGRFPKWIWLIPAAVIAAAAVAWRLASR